MHMYQHARARPKVPQLLYKADLAFVSQQFPRSNRMGTKIMNTEILPSQEYINWWLTVMQRKRFNT